MGCLKMIYPFVQRSINDIGKVLLGLGRNLVIRNTMSAVHCPHKSCRENRDFKTSSAKRPIDHSFLSGYPGEIIQSGPFEPLLDLTLSEGLDHRSTMGTMGKEF